MAKKYKVMVMDTVRDMDTFMSTLPGLLDNNVDIVRIDPDDEATVLREAPDCDGVINILSYMGKDLLAKFTKCKIIVRLGIGYDNVDWASAAKLGIMVANVPDYCQGEVADHAMALFLALHRRLLLADRNVRKGIWDDTILAPDTPRLIGRKFGILGYGFIGRAAGARAKAFGMEVIAYDPWVDTATCASQGIRKIDDLDQFLGESDFISLHIPANTENHNFIHLERLKKMKKTCILINTARGPIINEPDLYFALKTKIIAAAGLDVQVNEPPKQPSPFAELDNVILTPHIAFYSIDAHESQRVKAAEEITRTLLEGRPKFWVNRENFVPRG